MTLCYDCANEIHGNCHEWKDVGYPVCNCAHCEPFAAEVKL